MQRIIIAIDGFSSCGKSTLAKQLARHLRYTYIDSGAMYRAVALFALEEGLVREGKLDGAALLQELESVHVGFHFDAHRQRSETWLNGRNVEHLIRGMEVSRFVTLVSPLPKVRAKLVRLQQDLGREKGVVMDGRDIGTVVFPNAEVKLYMTARPEVRAQRRYDELRAKGVEVDLASVLENIHQRDTSDQQRAQDPLLQAPDAVLIDNSDLSGDAQFELALAVVERALGRVPLP
jgi:CMP/dCMP kinase